jgi:hypothetical protein
MTGEGGSTSPEYPPGDWKAANLRAGICSKSPGHCILEFVLSVIMIDN